MDVLILLAGAVTLEEDGVGDPPVARGHALIDAEEAAQVELALGLDPAGVVFSLSY